MVHVVRLKRTITCEVRVDEEYEGILESLTEEEAYEAAIDAADEVVFVSVDAAEYVEAKDTGWGLESHSTEGSR